MNGIDLFKDTLSKPQKRAFNALKSTILSQETILAIEEDLFSSFDPSQKKMYKKLLSGHKDFSVEKSPFGKKDLRAKIVDEKKNILLAWSGVQDDTTLPELQRMQESIYSLLYLEEGLVINYTKGDHTTRDIVVKALPPEKSAEYQTSNSIHVCPSHGEVKNSKLAVYVSDVTDGGAMKKLLVARINFVYFS